MTYSLRVMIIAGKGPYFSHYFQFLCWKTQNPVSTTYGFRVLCLIHSCGVISHCRVKQMYLLIKLHLWCPRLKKRWPFAVQSGDLPSLLMAMFCKMPACGWVWSWVGASVSSWHISSFFIFFLKNDLKKSRQSSAAISFSIFRLMGSVSWMSHWK